jgi:hypothetical protein
MFWFGDFFLAGRSAALRTGGLRTGAARRRDDYSDFQGAKNILVR